MAKFNPWVQTNDGIVYSSKAPNFVLGPGDNLPAVIEQKVQSTHPGIVHADDLGKKIYKPNFTMNTNNLPAVIDNPKPSYPSGVVQDALGQKTYKPNFTMQGNQLALPAPEGMVDDVARLSPWGKLAKHAAPAMRAANAMASSAPGKLMLHPVTGAVIMAAQSDDANAGEDDSVMIQRRNMGLASDARPLEAIDPMAIENAQRMLAGVPAGQAPKASNKPQSIQPNLAQFQPSVASPMSQDGDNDPVIDNDNDGDGMGRMVPKNVSFSMSQRNHIPVNQPMDDGDGMDSEENPNDDYTDMIKSQQAAYNKKLADSTEFGYLDLSPAMQWVDNMTGGNSAKGYKAPPKAEQDLDKVNGLGQQLAEYDMNKQKNEVAMLNALKQKEKTNPYDLATFKHNQSMARIAAGNKVKADNRNEKPPTAAQYQAAGYAARLQQAEADLSSSSYDRTSYTEGLRSFLPNAVKSEDIKKREQTELNFINTVLRDESGAAIGDPEYLKAEKQYFPRVGDTPDVLEQKRRNRQSKLATFRAEAGGKALDTISSELDGMNSSAVRPNNIKSKSTPTAQPVNAPTQTPTMSAVQAEMARRKAQRGL